MAHIGPKPEAVLSGETQSTSGSDALSMNVAAGSAIAEAVRTTLGPRGMDKMLVSGDGEVVVTNDGATVLSEMDVDHPTAEMVVDVANSQESEVGDGTTTAVIVAGALLDAAEDLLDRGLHPSTIVGGYGRAADRLPGLLEPVTVEVSPDDTALLEAVARTALTGKGSESAVETLAPLIVEAVRRTVTDGTPDIDAIKVHPFRGRPVTDSRLVTGMMVDRQPDHPNMTVDREDAEILIFDGELGTSEGEVDPNVEVSDHEQLQSLIEREREQLAELAAGIVETDIDVLFTTGGIDDEITWQLAEGGVLSAASLRDPDIEKLEATTGASPVADLGLISEDDIGFAGSVRRELIRGKYGVKSASPERTMVLEDVPVGEAVTLVLRGSTEHVVDEIERATEDALRVVAETLENGLVVPGGGATEIEVAMGLRDAADGVAGREQLAVEAVADALETVPRTLAENGGLDPIDALVDLRSAHDAGDHAAGIDVRSGSVTDMRDGGVVEPLAVKIQALRTGIETVNSILRIDDVISIGELSTGDEEEGPDTGLNPYS